MKRPQAASLLALLVLFVPACGGSNGETLKVAESDGQAPEGSIASPAAEPPSVEELDQILVGYANCLSKDFAVQIRFRADRFDGMELDLAALAEDSTPAVGETKIAACEQSVNLDSEVLGFQQSRPLTQDQLEAIAADYVECISGILPNQAGAMTSIRTRDDAVIHHAEMVADLNSQQAVDAENCLSTARYGPIQIF